MVEIDKKLFWTIFLAIIAAGTVAGITKYYLEYREAIAFGEAIEAESKKLTKEMEKWNVKTNDKFKNMLPRQGRRQYIEEKRQIKKKEPICRPAKINGVWQNHCE